MFWSKLLLSTGEATNYNKELTKNVKHPSKKIAWERSKKTIHWNLFLDVVFLGDLGETAH